jgi:mRNA interferase HicA
VTSSELKRWLAARGCTFEEGTKHTKIFYQGKMTLLPRHGKKELPRGTVEGIKRKLGLKGESK